jgi:hypothetical protein
MISKPKEVHNVDLVASVKKLWDQNVADITRTAGA